MFSHLTEHLLSTYVTISYPLNYFLSTFFLPTIHISVLLFVCHFRFPIALDVVLYQKRVLSFLLWCAISFVTIAVSLSSLLLPLLPLTISFPPSLPLPSPSYICSLSKIPLLAVDSLYYGRLVLAPLNIIIYNVFGKGGPTLYGKISHMHTISVL